MKQYLKDHIQYLSDRRNFRPVASVIGETAMATNVNEHHIALVIQQRAPIKESDLKAKRRKQLILHRVINPKKIN